MEAMKFKAAIQLGFQNRMVNGKSVTDVMSLGAAHGDVIQIQVEGVDAVLALNALIALIQNN